jgi:hypothetical protein
MSVREAYTLQKRPKKLGSENHETKRRRKSGHSGSLKIDQIPVSSGKTYAMIHIMALRLSSMYLSLSFVSQQLEGTSFFRYWEIRKYGEYLTKQRAAYATQFWPVPSTKRASQAKTMVKL